LKGLRDRIPALRRKGMKGRKKPEKTSHFLFGGEYKNINFVVPKAK
jgi:hypothetical protein